MNSYRMHAGMWRFVVVMAMLLPLRIFAANDRGAGAAVLSPESFQHYFMDFANDEREMLGTAPPVPWDWLVANVPWLDIPDKEMERIYYFRWYAFQKHICKSEDGYLISEFLDDVPWSGKHNMIDAAAGHHIREARWLRNPAIAEDYTKFWFGPEGEPRRYSFWASDSVYQLFLATGNRSLPINLLPALETNYEAWESTHKDANGLFWQIDDRDGMEDSISGTGYRPTINSYMYGDAVAISRIAEMAGQEQTAAKYQAKADHLKTDIEAHLWNPNDSFYETVTRLPSSGLTGDRELIGFIPWYFNIPPPQHDSAWKLLFDPQGFAGKFGPTTAERRNPRFDYPVRHECLWNGPSWPFATTQTLIALANLLNGPSQNVVNDLDYFHLLSTYANSQHIQTSNGKLIPWIDEDLNADTGDWIARNILAAQHALPKNRGRYYNHSGFADLIISGLIGVRPEEGNSFTLHPLIPTGMWDYFALDGLPYHGRLLTIMYDRDGTHYRRGPGLQVFCDGELVAHSTKLQQLRVKLPAHE